MAVTLHTAITFDGRVCPLPPGSQAPKAAGAAVFRNARRAASICEWVDSQDGETAIRCEILNAAAAPVATALVVGGCVDELHLTVCPIVSARLAAATLTGPPTPEFLPRAIRLELLAMEPDGDLCRLRYRVGNSQRRLASGAARATVT